jgi:hypothetical protein
MRKSRRLRLTPLVFGTGANHWVAMTCLPVLLFGCTAGSKSLPPYALSDAETTTVERAATTVERAIYPTTKDLDKPGFSRPQSREK